MKLVNVQWFIIFVIFFNFFLYYFKLKEVDDDEGENMLCAKHQLIESMNCYLFIFKLIWENCSAYCFYKLFPNPNYITTFTFLLWNWFLYFFFFKRYNTAHCPSSSCICFSCRCFFFRILIFKIEHDLSVSILLRNQHTNQFHAVILLSNNVFNQKPDNVFDAINCFFPCCC